jgi:penicillin-binding protein 2
MATMISAVATRGRLPTPHLIRGQQAAAEHLDVHPATYEIVRRALRQAVESGTGQAADLGEIRVAGKTGTAQVFRHSAGVDPDDLPKQERDHGWFVGYAPTERPTIAFAVVVEHGGHGGTSAAPVARRVLEVYFDRRPDPTADGDRIAGPGSEEESRVRSATAG